MGDDHEARRIFTDLRVRSRRRLAWIILALVLGALVAFHAWGTTDDLRCVREAATRLHIDPPALAYDPDLKHRALYVWSTIILRPDADCGVIVHELVHHRQFRDAGGPAADAIEWLAREIQARRLELMWRGMQ